jgi:AcrR family transcriptional regulator
MPIALSNETKIKIKKNLIEAAEISLMEFGAKKTTVDNLVKKVNIPKGTFYLFYPSKAMLLYEVFQIKHDELNNKFLKRVFEIKDNLTALKVSNLIYDVYKELDTSFLMSFMTSGDLELVLSQLSAEVFQKHIEGDEISMEKILSIIPNISKEMSNIYSASLRLVMTSVLYKNEVGIEYFDDALRLSIMGIVNQIFEGVTL